MMPPAAATSSTISGVEIALLSPCLEAVRTGFTAADLTDRDCEAVAAEATEGATRARAASAETTFFIYNSKL